MAGRFSNIYAGFLLDAAFGTAHSADFPTPVFIGLSSTLPANDGTNITEPVGNAYARVSVANTDANWPDTGVDRIKLNGIAITFPQPTGSWGTMTHFVVMTLSAAGAMIAWGALDTPRTIGAANDPPSFAIGGIVLSAPGT